MQKLFWIALISAFITLSSFAQVPACGQLPPLQRGASSYLNVAKSATGTGTETDPFIGWEDAVNRMADYSLIDFPPGKYLRTKTIFIKRYWHIQGAGKGVTKIVSYGTVAGDAIRSHWPNNCSVGIYFEMDGLTLENLTEAGYRLHQNNAFVDIGGTYLTIRDIQITGFLHGMIFDQTEIFSVSNSILEDQGRGGIWIVNGDEYQTGNHGGYTNVIGLRELAFNQEPQSVGLIVDGCYTLNLEGCSFNGGKHAAWLAGIQTGAINSNHIEGASSHSVVTSYHAYGHEPGTGHDKGANFNLGFYDNTIVNSANAPIQMGYFQVAINNLLSSRGYSIRTGWNIVPPILLYNVNSYNPSSLINDKSIHSYFWLNDPTYGSNLEGKQVTITQATTLPAGACEDIPVSGFTNLLPTDVFKIVVTSDLAGANTRVPDQTVFTPIYLNPTTVIVRRCNIARTGTTTGRGGTVMVRASR